LKDILKNEKLILELNKRINIISYIIKKKWIEISQTNILPHFDINNKADSRKTLYWLLWISNEKNTDEW
jgi:hypothetical protein